MIGQQIESRPRFPVGATLFFLVALALVVAGLLVPKGSVHYFVGAALPLFIALFLLLTREPAFAAEFTREGIEVHNPPTLIPYDSIEGLWGRGRSSDPDKPGPRSFQINVAHEEGVLRIPARLNVSSDDVYLFLYDQFPPEGSRGTIPLLAEHLEEQERTFGQERVWCYRGRHHVGIGTKYPRAIAVCWALVAAAVVWIGAAIALKNEAWGGCGGLLLLFGLLFLLAFVAEGRRGARPVKNAREAGLVISPVGLALVQGDLKGEMRWDELRDVQYRSRPASFSMDAHTGRPGIILKFPGADIVIADIYDQPLRVIYERIRGYWK